MLDRLTFTLVENSLRTIFRTAFRSGYLLIVAGFIAACATPSNPNYNRPMPITTMSQVVAGMNVQDLRKVLGSPSLVDGFHPNLWVYLFVDPESKTPWQAYVQLNQEKRVQTSSHRIADTDARPSY